MVPYKEQEAPMEEGRTYLVYMYLDSKSGRLVGTTKLGRFLDNDHIPLEKGDEVELMVLRNSSLGVNVMINEMHTGLIFENDVNQPLKIGQKLVGFIKTIREDNKIDVVIKVQEGNKYYFGDVDFIGNSVYSDAQLSRVLGIKPGDTYNGVLLRKRIADQTKPDGDDLTNLYQNKLNQRYH